MAFEPTGKTWECFGSHCAGGAPARLTWSCAGGCCETWGARQVGWWVQGAAAYCPTCTMRSPHHVKQMIRWLRSAAEDKRYCMLCKPPENPLNFYEEQAALANVPAGLGAGAAASSSSSIPDIGGDTSVQCSWPATAGGADPLGARAAVARGVYHCADCPAWFDGNCPRGRCDPLWVARCHGWLPSKNKLSYCSTCVKRRGPFYKNQSMTFMTQAKADDRLCGGCSRLCHQSMKFMAKAMESVRPPPPPPGSFQ